MPSAPFLKSSQAVVQLVSVVIVLVGTVTGDPLVVAVALVVLYGPLALVARHRRRHPVVRGSVVPFPAGLMPWVVAEPGVLAVGTTEVVTWALDLRGRAVGAPVAVVPRARIHDATFEEGHRLVGGGWIHLVDIDGERAVLAVSPLEDRAAWGVVAALSRDRSVAAG